MPVIRSPLQVHTKLLGICKSACFCRRMALKQAALPGSGTVSMTQRQSLQRAPAVPQLTMLMRPLSEDPQQVREAQYCVHPYLEYLLCHTCEGLQPGQVSSEVGQPMVSLRASASVSFQGRQDAVSLANLTGSTEASTSKGWTVQRMILDPVQMTDQRCPWQTVTRTMILL